MPVVDFSGGAVFLDAATVDCGDVDFMRLREVAKPLHIYPQTTAQELPERHPDAWCVITNKVKLDHNFFKARPNLRLVCVTATGVNNVDLQAAADHGVTVANCKGYSTETVAQHTFMLLLALVRSLPQYQHAMAQGEWSHSPMFCLLDYPLRELRGMKLGIVGYGDIGQRVAEIARFFGMEILIAERPESAPRPGRLSFAEVLSRSDILTLHCPLTSDNAKLINTKTLALMQRSAFLINTARGGLIDEVALVEALRENKLGGAALDVLSAEPPPADHPLLQAKLPNLILTPHCAWASAEARQRVIDQTAENITRYYETCITDK
jgi:glycerate dehydrogenase